MDESSKKISLGTAICIFIIFILLIVLGIVYYFGFIKTTKTDPSLDVNQQNYSTSETNQNVSNSQEEETTIAPDNVAEIPTEDLFTLNFEATETGMHIFYAYLNNGILNYYIDSKVSNGVKEGAFDFISSYATLSTNTDNIKQYSQLKNIKRIKTYNIGTSVNPESLLITEDGQVYLLNITSDNNMHINLYEPFKNYKVEDILSATGEMATTFELLLQNGSKESVTVDLD